MTTTKNEKIPAPKKIPRLTLEKARERAEKIKQEHKAAQLELARLIYEQKKANEVAARAEETRRKILLGAYLLAQAQAQGWDLAALKIGQQTLDQYLTKSDDRALFSLPPLASEAEPEG
jgi:hypothetical protein